MKIVTFNLRRDNAGDGDNRFWMRKEEIIECIQKEEADVIGFQEILPHMQEWMENNMPEYYFVGHGREADLGEEGIVVAFRKDKFRMRFFHSFWLSPTPQEPGSRYEGQSSCPRTCIALTLYSVEDQKSFRVFNTHLDHVGSFAKKEGIKQVVEYCDKMNEADRMPSFIMGDFNVFPDQDELTPISANPQYVDVSGHIPVTFHGFYSVERKIDYIYVNDMVKPRECYIWESEKGRPCLSDHNPVCLICEI